MKTTGSIVVVGSGIFGLTGALELKRRGYKVTIVDSGQPPNPLASSTDVSKIIRMDYGSDEFYTELMEVAFRGWKKWDKEWDENFYHQDGMLFMSDEEMQPGSYEYESFSVLEKRGHQVIRLDSKTLKKRFPAWASQNYPDGYFNPNDGWAESEKVLAKLIQDAKSMGIFFRECSRMTNFIETDNRIVGIFINSNEKLFADYTIIAAGAWTPTILPEFHSFTSIVGQPVYYFLPKNPEKFRHPQFSIWAANVSKTGWYGFSALPNGIVKIANHGAGQPISPDSARTINPQMETTCRAFLQDTFPELAESPIVEKRLCLYCDTWDGSFYIDHHPSRPGIFVASGGSGHGFKFAPYLGKLIADSFELIPNRFTNRFVWRSESIQKSKNARRFAIN